MPIADDFQYSANDMSTSRRVVPLSLYVHFPWCVRKCPYCDFRSHSAPKHTIPEAQYVQNLLADLQKDLPYVQNRTIHTLFLGGGTPSLFSPRTIHTLLDKIYATLPVANTAEITLEANPNTCTPKYLRDLRASGVNRLSLGIQSFSDHYLQKLGRIHSALDAHRAIQAAHTAKFENVNIDLMFGLPEQSIEDALQDLRAALQYQPKHLSWYQLTIEDNTPFSIANLRLPPDNTLNTMQQRGKTFIEQQGYTQYEISAYAQNGYTCAHNLNYWNFGDYIGIGANAHGKITNSQTQQILRYQKHDIPLYLQTKNYTSTTHIVSPTELPLEFMLNALRLSLGFPLPLFTERTGLALEKIIPQLQWLEKHHLLRQDNHHVTLTARGREILNNVLEVFCV